MSVDVLRYDELDNLTDYDDGSHRIKDLRVLIGNDAAQAGVAVPRRGDALVIGSDTWKVDKVDSIPEVGQHELIMKLVADSEKSNSEFRIRRT